MVAKEGVITTSPEGDRYLVLKNGRRYQGTPGSADVQTMEFERYSMRVATKTQELDGALGVDAMPSAVLFKGSGPVIQGEILWRIALPITCLLLPLLAIPLGFVNPRAGSSSNLIVALLIFFSYNNLVKVLEGSVRQGKMSFGLSWWPLHLALAIIVVLMFVWRLNVNHRYHPRVLWAALKRGKGAAKEVKQ